MNSDEFYELATKLGLCDCTTAHLVPLLRELLEIGEMREPDDEDDEEEEEFDSWLADTRMRACANDWTLRQWVLGSMGAAGLIEHQEHDLDGYMLTEFGSEVLGYLREHQAEALECGGTDKDRLN